MDPFSILILVSAGIAAGFLGALIGLGGGIIFAPVLFFYFGSIGIPDDIITPLTIGSSLFCTMTNSAAGAWYQHRQNSVLVRVALQVGLYSAVITFLMTRFVTTQPWYSARISQVIFSLVLLAVSFRMLFSRRPDRSLPEDEARDEKRYGPAALAATGTVAGAISVATGVGGGVVLVPAYTGPLRIPVRLAMGTSNATIAFVSLAGVLSYVLLGLGANTPSTALGFVDFGHAAALAVPSIFASRVGVWTAHRTNTRVLRTVFAIIAAIVAVRLLLGGD